MSALISKFDFLGKTPNIMINGETKHKTVIGGILSITIGVFILLIIYYFLNILISRTNFTVINIENFNEDQKSDLSVLNIAIGVTGETGLDIPDEERVFRLKANIYYYYPAIINGTLTMKLETNDIQLEKCDLEKHFKKSAIYNKWKELYGINKMYCAVPEQKLEIQKPFGYNNYKQLVYWIQKCQNNTEIKNCLPEEEINKRLMNVYVGLRSENIYFDHYDYLNPNKYYIDTQGCPASISIFKNCVIKVKNVEYDTDDNYIGTSYNPKIYPITTEKWENIRFSEDKRSPGSFSCISLIYGSFSTQIFRKYYKLQNMLADVGALIKGLIIILTIFNQQISERVFYNDIARKSIGSLEAIGIEKYSVENQDNKLSICNNISETPAKLIIKKKVDQLYLNNMNQDNKNIPIHKIENVPNKEYSISNVINMNTLLLILPKFLVLKNSLKRKKLEIHEKIKLRINEQLDLVNIFSKLNMVDKIQYIISGFGKKNLLEDIINPYIFSDENLNLNTNIPYVRDEIIKGFK